MARKVQVYDQKINEYVDWVTGVNTLTGELETNGLPVSGGLIRDLLQNRLKAPIYFYYDENNSLYRIFASKDTFDLWASDKEMYADLELGNFVAPSPFTATFTGLSEETKYIRNGDNSNTTLNFRWNIEGKNQSNYSDSVTVTYTFNNNGILSIPIKYSHALLNITFDMSPYLKIGTNTVTVSLLGDTTNAVTSISFNVEVLDLSISSLFKCYSPVGRDQAIEINYTVEGSGTYGRTVDFYIDGVLKSTYTINAQEYTFQGILRIAGSFASEPGKHTLQIIAHITINNINYYSNLLYYEFVVEGFTDTTSKYATVEYSFGGNVTAFTLETVKFTAVQYEDFILSWGFYTSDPYNTTKTVSWKVKFDNVEEEQTITSTTAKLNTATDSLIYTPAEYGRQYLRAYVDDILIGEYELQVYKNSNNVEETPGYIFKLSAKGRSNSEPSALRESWEYTYDNFGEPVTYSTSFSNFLWNYNSGWNNNALVLSNGATAQININPLKDSVIGALTANNTTGFAFEIEFETFNIGDTSQPIIYMGDLNGASILITPNSAFMTNSTNAVRIKTNFKEGEKIKLAFILNSSVSADQRLLFIVNNGILERGIAVPGETFNADGIIHLNGTDTGLRIYSMRLYDKAISYNEEFANFVIDSGNITEIITRNNVYDSLGNISEELCEQKLDTILITGALNTVLGAEDKRAEACVDILRICLKDPKYSFLIKNGRIRRHGQSTLNYPVPNFKIWSDSVANAPNAGTPIMYDNTGAVIYKGRYQFKDGAIPAKKWVLQANYADSSGVHNGGLMRLINDTWFGARINGEYKLRTDPQLFTTDTGKFSGNGWQASTGVLFPYNIRVAPDSFPCVVFWREDDLSAFNFLGQYVFMDDKKADYIYGERSIYKRKDNLPNDDPFRLKGDAPKKKDMDCLWDNENTLKIEILSVNTPYVNYTTNANWEDRKTSNSSDSNRTWMFNWETNFEPIYPDPDDLYNVGEEDQKDLNDHTILSNKFKPFSDWIAWLVSCYNDYANNASADPNSTTRGTYGKFYAEAEDHLDLYKLAAYYVYVLRFGLVDSLLRNAEIKTYDGQHFHYEPWDMDIALGNKNTGGIAFDPPIDRNTQDPDNPGNYWISGKYGQGEDATSCFLWDALEAWTTLTDEHGVVTRVGWIDNIVPAVSNALYAAGLTYDNVMTMFDDNYQNYWCERMYNDSGHFKYIENGQGTLLQYLQGARTSHRHWWTKTSFDYWDAKWASGDFRTNSVTIITNTTSTGQKIRIVPSTTTYFSFYNGTTGAIEETFYGEKNDLNSFFTMNTVLSTKDPRLIFGSLYIKSLDISEIVQSLERLNLSGLYNSSTGTNIESLNIGMPWNDMVNGKFNFKNNVAITNYQNLTKLNSLYVRGYRNINSFVALVNPLTNLLNFYSAGSGLTIFSASEIGNQFNHIELPTTIQELSLKNSSWQELYFYHSNTESGTHTEEINEYDDNNNIISTITIEVPNATLNPVPLYEYKASGQYTGSRSAVLPSGLKTIILEGNTGQNKCSRDLVIDWVNLLYTNDAFEGKTLVVEDANWKGSSGISYSDLMKIAEIPNLTLKGYIKLTDNVEPTATLLTTIMEKFGEHVFSLGSDLTIDYEHNSIVISVPSPAYIEDDHICIKEKSYITEDNQGNIVVTGEKIRLQASVFSLTNEERIQRWGIKEDPNATSWGLTGAAGVSLNSLTGEITIPETSYNEREIYLQVQDRTNESNIRRQSVTLYIKKRLYPSSIGIYMQDYPDVLPLEGNYYIGQNRIFNFAPKFYNSLGEELSEFDGTIKSYKWSFTNNNNRLVQSSDKNTRSSFAIDFRGLPAFTLYETLSLEITFADNSVLTTSIGLALLESVAVLEDDDFAGSPELFRLMTLVRENNILLYPSTTPSSYLSETLASFVGKFDLSLYEGDSRYTYENSNTPINHKNHIYNFRSAQTADTNNILLFLTNITELKIPNFPVLNEVLFNDMKYNVNIVPYVYDENLSLGDAWKSYWFEKIDMSNDCSLTSVDFHPVTELKELNLSGCSGLSDITISDNTKLTKLIAENSTFAPYNGVTIGSGNNAITLSLNLTVTAGLTCKYLADSSNLEESDDSNDGVIELVSLGVPTHLDLENVEIERFAVNGLSNLTTVSSVNCGDNMSKVALDIVGSINFTDSNVKTLLSTWVTTNVTNKYSNSNLITSSDVDGITELELPSRVVNTIDLINCKNLRTLTVPSSVTNLYLNNLNKVTTDSYDVHTLSVTNCSQLLAAEIFDKMS